VLFRSGHARLLTGERDQNFYLRADDNAEYLLKIANEAESDGTLEFQNSALDHIARSDPVCPVPRVMHAGDGEGMVCVDGAVVRLLSWLPGELLHEVEPSPDLLRDLGAVHGRLGLALRDFDHPSAHHELMWDMSHTLRLEPLLAHLVDPRQRSLAEAGLARFKTRAVSALPGLRAQVIHNDLNPHNVVIAPDGSRVSGIIDFGDMVHAPLICDVAVAASYFVRGDANPLAAVSTFLAAYHDVSPIEPEERDILLDLIVARLTMTVLITNWRAERYPGNRAYILRNAPAAWAGLHALQDSGDQLELDL